MLENQRSFLLLFSSFLSDNTSSVGAEGKLYLAESSLISRQKTSQGQRVVVTSILLRPWPCQHAPDVLNNILSIRTHGTKNIILLLKLVYADFSL